MVRPPVISSLSNQTTQLTHGRFNAAASLPGSTLALLAYINPAACPQAAASSSGEKTQSPSSSGSSSPQIQKALDSRCFSLLTKNSTTALISLVSSTRLLKIETYRFITSLSSPLGSSPPKIQAQSPLIPAVPFPLSFAKTYIHKYRSPFLSLLPNQTPPFVPLGRRITRRSLWELDSLDAAIGAPGERRRAFGLSQRAFGLSLLSFAAAVVRSNASTNRVVREKSGVT